MMPLSKCPYCGKKVPNIFRQYHMRAQCRVMRARRGETLPEERPAKEPEKTGQRRLDEEAPT